MRTLEERRIVKELHAQGKNNSEISRITGISRRTVSDIVLNKFTKRIEKIGEEFDPSKFTEEQEKAYSYILGQYLGDGHISLMRRNVYRLRIFSDCKYPNIIQEIKDKMSIILPENTPGSNVYMNNGKTSCDSISIYSKKIKNMFPQHGEKEKHSRLIKLELWQQNIVDKYPKDFLRGLIHSDGCRFIPTTTQDQNARYQFTNVSTDIIKIYCATLEKLNISYSISQKAIKGKMKHHSYNIFTQRKECVRILDTFIGPKT